jgi:AGZA family xanthine/uracil permease-like MFS transporter
LLTIFSLTALALLRGKVSMPTEFFSSPDFTSVFLKLDVWGALKWSLFPAILSLMLTDMFDSISSFLGVARAANLMDEKGEPKNLKKALVVDAIATMFSGLLGTSSGTTFIESASGIQAGGRTGVSSVFTALFFLPCLFIAPLVVSIPAFATAPVLILVGFMMGRSILEVKEDEMESWLPALATTIIITLSFSISKGLMWGIFLHIVLKVFTSKTKEISPLLWGLGLVSILYLFVL